MDTPSFNLISTTPNSYGASFSLFNNITFNKASASAQGNGEANALSIPWHDLQENPDIFSLLRWNTRVSDFIGRDGEMAELDQWAKSDRNVSIKFVTGPGGVGKTRLAAEFGTVLQKEKWAAGFVDLRSDKPLMGHLEGTLLIIDYPEDDPTAVKRLLQDMAKITITGKLRALFLTRQKISDWMGFIRDAKADALTDMEPVRLVGLDSGSAHDIYLSTSNTFGDAHGANWKPVGPAAMAHWMTESPENDQPLFIMAAAVHNVLQPDEAAIKYQGAEIVKLLAEREMRRLFGLATKYGPEFRHLFARLLAMATIADGIPVNRLGAMLKKMEPPHKWPEHFDAASELRGAGLIFQDRIQAVKPDIVAAAFLVEVFGQTPDIAPELVWIVLDADMDGGMRRLGRLSYDAEVGLGLCQHRLSRWLAEAVAGRVERAKKMAPFVSKAQLSMGLLDVAIETWRALLPITEKPSEQARILNHLSLRLSDVGDRHGAIAAILKAVEINEGLSVANPETFEPDLAGSLTNLGKGYSELAQREKALEVCQRTVEIYGRLAAVNPDAFEPDLAMSLNNLGIYYSELGKREEAMEACQRAVKIYERLSAANPETFEPVLATSLNNLGNRYSKLGQREEAMEACQRAVKIRERLSAANPDAFEPDLAMSLNNLGVYYSELGQREEALEACQRAVEIREHLAVANPDAFEADLAMSNGVMGNAYRISGEYKKSAEAFKNGVSILKRLFLLHPKAFGSLMIPLVQYYLETSEKAGVALDDSLLSGILEILQDSQRDAP